MKLKNDLLLRAAKEKKTERTPVLVDASGDGSAFEYRVVREKLADSKSLLKHLEFAAEVTIQPVDILDVDAAIIFLRHLSDSLKLWVFLIKWLKARVPWFEQTVPKQGRHRLVKIAEADDLPYVMDALV